MSYTINAAGRLLDLQTPVVMGILNATPDSFYAGSRTQTEAEIAARVHQIVDEGAGIIDVGAYSSRPGADDVPAEEEARRLRHALDIVRREAPDAIISVDTFRADVAKMCIEEGGAHIINDISGGTLDKNMFRTVARLRVPYILMHIQGEPHTMQQAPHYNNLEQEVFLFLSQRVDQLRQLGVADIILDPGFGFGKTLAHNYELMNRLEDFREFDLPLLVGISRKSMIYKLLGTTPAEALGGTIALNTIALMKGAHILRVHDVRAAVETVRIVETLKTGL
ncbi:MAG: dihydropteroate synthase [Bacteroidales bacterium]|nr:dihydropteroate synthase [Bacteroidales bacterium]